MSERFRTFLSGLRTGGYCVDCLGKIYEEPATAIDGYLKDLGFAARHDECANCGEQKDTFRDTPSR